MKAPLLSMCLALIILKVNAQQSVKISISNPIAKDGTEIFFFKSIGRKLLLNFFCFKIEIFPLTLLHQILEYASDCY